MSDASHLKPGAPSEYQGVERRQNERRSTLRYPFCASVDAVEPRSNAKIIGRTSDISLGGCYVETISPFAVETIIKVRLAKENSTFEADAKVVISHVGMGMGIVFISALPQQIRVFQKWLNDLKGESVPAAYSEQTQNNAGEEILKQEHDNVLTELLIALMRKGVISDTEGKAMLQRLHR